MPVISSPSSIRTWPDRRTVDAAARRWADRERRRHPEVLRLGYFGSYARGDWGVGSDLDLLALVSQDDRSFIERPLGWDLMDLPVPAEILVYTQAEWARLQREGGRFVTTLEAETVWL
jgi:predicted nucleotidyltransferase